MLNPTFPGSKALVDRSPDVKPLQDGHKGWMVTCPSHNDPRNSLHVWEEGGKVHLHCFAACTPDEVLTAAGLTWSDGFFEERRNGATPKAERKRATPVGKPYIVSQFGEAKHWRQNTLNPDGTPGKEMWWQPSGVHPTQFLYGGDLVDQHPHHSVILVEGETPAAAITQLVLPWGYVVAASVCGASSIPDQSALKPLFGRKVLLWPDCDEPGRRHMTKIAANLKAQGATVLWVLWEGREKEDAADALQQGVDIEALLQASGPYGPSSPPPSDAGPPAPAGADQDAKDRARTDMGNAERLVDAYGQDIHFCHPWKKWLVWADGRWQEDDVGDIVRKAKATARAIYASAADIEDTDRRASLVKWAITSETRSRLEAMVALAQSEPKIPILPAQMDTHRWLINVANGTLDLENGMLRPHRREDYLTKMAGTHYDPDADAPLFKQFLARILPDHEVRAYIQRWCGYCLTGLVSERRLPVWFGVGSNGKSTLLAALRGVMGQYSAATTSNLLVQDNQGHQEHPTALADLFGVRFAASSEIDMGARLSEALVKQLTGGDRMKARRMHQDFFEWEPTHKIILVTNHKPVIRGMDPAIWGRLDVVPFTVTIPDNEKDARFGEKLVAEYPGILNWAVDGCIDWQINGLGRPSAVIEAGASYRSEMDNTSDFFEECCIFGPEAFVSAGSIRNAYESWCQEGGGRPIPAQPFAMQILARGVERDLLQHKRIYRGIGLRALGDQ